MNNQAFNCCFNKKHIIIGLAIYLLISFGLVWGMAFLYLGNGGEYGTKAMELILACSMLCPTIGVLVAKKLMREKLALIGPDSLLLGISFRDKKWKWYVLALLLPVIYGDLGYLAIFAVFPQTFDPAGLELFGISQNGLILLPLAGIMNGIIVSFGALGEEIGWRTYLYPRLEALMGTGKAVILGGVIWSVWHFPFVAAGHGFGKDYWGEPFSGFAIFTLSAVSLGALLFLVTKKTGSIWPAAFLHAVNNTGLWFLAPYLNMDKIASRSPSYILLHLLLELPTALIAIVATWYMVRKRKSK